MKKMVAAISFTTILMLVASTVLAHDGVHERENKGIYQEGSGGSAMEMGRKSHMGHEYKGEGSGMEGEHSGMEHSKKYYEKKYGKYDHEKQNIQEEGSAIKDEAMKMREMQHQRMEEGIH
tara:strand:- start:2046 stop:2405 length:360 start_codon:yes stop_codon:yes gene_type:complete